MRTLEGIMNTAAYCSPTLPNDVRKAYALGIVDQLFDSNIIKLPEYSRMVDAIFKWSFE